MRGRFATAATILLIAGCAGCAGEQVPLAPSPTLVRLTITPLGGGRLIVGDSVPIVTSGGLPGSGAVVLGAFADYSDRTGRYVDATWRSDNEDILAIVGSSLVARGRGTATLTASFDRLTDTETFLVEAGVPGRWSGVHVVEECAASAGSIAEVVCGAPGRAPGMAAVGATLPIAMEITERGEDLTAEVSLHQTRGTLSGRKRGSGLFTLSGNIDAAQLRISFVHWDAGVAGDRMEGFIGYEIRIAGVPGLAQVAAKFVNVVRQ